MDVTDDGVWYVARGGYVSYRLTVNGSTSRFFVPADGDPDYAPVLLLELTNSTGTTTSTNTTTTTTARVTSTNATTTTNTSTTSKTSATSTNTTITTTARVTTT